MSQCYAPVSVFKFVMLNGVLNTLTASTSAPALCYKALVNVRLPRTALSSYSIDTKQHQESGVVLGWNDIQHLTNTDTTQATGPVERTIVYEAPFFKPNREEDYAVAWVFFAGGGC